MKILEHLLVFLHPTFQSACNAHGLLGNDEEWITALEEATLHATSYQMRHLLSVLILFCEISNPRNLFDMFWKSCTDDIFHELTSTTLESLIQLFLRII